MEMKKINKDSLWGTEASKLNDNFQAMDVEMQKISATTIKDAGVFATLEALQSARPTPHIGDTAKVGTELPYVIYVCEKAGVWKDSGATYTPTTQIPTIEQTIGDSETSVMSQNAVTKMLTEYDVSAHNGGKAYKLAGTAQVVRLTITGAPTADGTITVTLGGTATAITITAATQTTAALVAEQIATGTFAGYTVSYTSGNAYVDFTASAVGEKTAPAVELGATGVTGSISVTKAGADSAIAAVPTEFQKGGLTIAFVDSSSGNYVKYFCNSPVWSGSYFYWIDFENKQNYIPQALPLLDNTDITLPVGTRKAREYALSAPFYLQSSCRMVTSGSQIALFRSSDGGNNYELVTRSHTGINVTASTEYMYRVRMRYASGSGVVYMNPLSADDIIIPISVLQSDGHINVATGEILSGSHQYSVSLDAQYKYIKLIGGNRNLAGRTDFGVSFQTIDGVVVGYTSIVRDTYISIPSGSKKMVLSFPDEDTNNNLRVKLYTSEIDYPSVKEGETGQVPIIKDGKIQFGNVTFELTAEQLKAINKASALPAQTGNAGTVLMVGSDGTLVWDNITIKLTDAQLNSLNIEGLSVISPKNVDSGNRFGFLVTTMGSYIASDDWNVYARKVNAGEVYNVKGRIKGMAAIVSLDDSGNVVASWDYANCGVAADSDNMYSGFSITIPDGATVVQASYYTYDYIDDPIVLFGTDNSKVSSAIARKTLSDYVIAEASMRSRRLKRYMGEINMDNASSLSPTLCGDYYIVSENNAYASTFIIKGREVGYLDVIWYDGKDFHVLAKNYREDYDVSDRNRVYDICIIGGGAGGIGAAYSLKDSGLDVCLIEQNDKLGGNHVSGMVVNFCPSPSPAFFEEYIYNPLKANGGIADFGNNYYKTQQMYCAGAHNGSDFAYDISGIMHFDRLKLSKKYHSDLANIDIKLRRMFVDVEDYADGIVSSVRVRNLTTGAEETIRAKFFIDASSTAVLSRACNGIIDVDYYVGADPYGRFINENSLIDSSFNGNIYGISGVDCCFRVERDINGIEDASKYPYIDGTYARVNAPSVDKGNRRFRFISPSTGAAISSKLFIDKGPDYVYRQAKANVLSAWRKIKEAGKVAATQNFDYSTYRFDRIAEILGIRESYRIVCDKMLDATTSCVQVTSNTDIATEHTIALGNWYFDIHGLNGSTDTVNVENAMGVNVTALKSMQPECFSIPIEALFPKKNKNCMIASRCLGASHLAAGTCRITKTMMSVGYAAGFTAQQYVERGLNDMRDVEVTDIQRKVKLSDTIAYLEDEVYPNNPYRTWDTATKTYVGYK